MFIYSSRNMLQPVNKLSPEILSRIAQDVLEHSDKDARKNIQPQRVLGGIEPGTIKSDPSGSYP